MATLPSRQQLFQNNEDQREAAAVAAFNSIINSALCTANTSVLVYVTVAENARGLLEQKLKTAKFGPIHYHQAYVIVENNPYAEMNLNELAKVYISVIAEQLPTAPRCGNEIRLSLTVPKMVRAKIIDAMSANDLDVEIVENPDQGYYIAVR